MKHHYSHWRDFRAILYWRLLLNSVEKIQENSVKMGEKIKDALHGDLRTYV